MHDLKEQKADKKEIRIGGFGGQGVILSGIIIGGGASIYDKKYSTLVQSFGPEARGGACNAQVTISDNKILYPYLTEPDILILMSQEAFNKYGANIKDNGIMLLEQDLVKPYDVKEGVRVYNIPATYLAEELGRKIVQNIVMTGFFTAVTGIVSYESIKSAILHSVPKGTETINISAFEKGFEYGRNLLEG